MDLHQEAMAALELAMETTPWGPSSLHMQPVQVRVLQETLKTKFQDEIKVSPKRKNFCMSYYSTIASIEFLIVICPVA